MQNEQLKIYLDRLNINFQEPSLALVEEIQVQHLANFSFNNIAVLEKQEISLDLKDIVEKIVIKNLGGYCFEHNALMYEVLKALGMNVRLLIGRVVNNTQNDVPRTHRITLLEYNEKKYLIDVGFGAMCPNKPLELSVTYSTTDEYRIVEDSGVYQLELLTKKEYFVLYKFDLQHYTQADCMMGNFYSSHYKDAVFMNNFVLALIMPELRLSLRNHTLHRIYKDKDTEVVNLSSAQQLCQVINEEFNIKVDETRCEILYLKL